MKRRIAFLFVLFTLGLVSNNYAKYVIEYTYSVVDIQIDRIAPTIHLTNTKNTNDTKEYANKSHTITMNINITEDNIQENNFNTKNVKILVGEKEVVPKVYNMTLKREWTNVKQYEITLSGIEGDGLLELKIPEGIIIDTIGNINISQIISSGITIDNTAPAVAFMQEEIQDGKIIAKFISNETVKDVNAWEKQSDGKTLTKEFANNVTYPFYITDLAGNRGITEVNVTKATNIVVNSQEIADQYLIDEWTKDVGTNNMK